MVIPKRGGSKSGGQSPELLLPDKDNLSDGYRSTRRENESRITSSANNQQPQQHTTLPMFGFPSPPHNRNSARCSSIGIPVSSLIHNIPYGNHNTATSGIMPLANLRLSSTSSPPAGPLRMLTFNTWSPKISPLNIISPHGQEPIYHGSDRSIHHFDRVDSSCSSKLPWLVPTLVAIHTVIFAITMYENDCPQNSPRPDKCVLRVLNRLSFQSLNENPLLGPSYKALLLMGALQSKLVTSSGQGWRLLTCVWLHAGVFHLFANGIGLLSIGLRLERDFGWLKVGTVYIMAGFGGSLLSALFMMQNQISVGASGALMGLLGATVAELLINWSTYHHRNRSLAGLLLAIAVNLSFGLMPHVDNFAHIGGLCAGVLLGFICLMRPRVAWVNQMVHAVDVDVNRNRLLKQHTRLQSAIWFVALGFLLVCYGTALLALFKGYGLEARRSCKWCHYMSCIPSFIWQCP